MYPRPTPINLYIDLMYHGYYWSGGRSDRPPSLSYQQRSAHKLSKPNQKSYTRTDPSYLTYCISYIGDFLDNDFWSPAHPPFNFVHGSHVSHGYHWSCSRSARPPSLF